MKTVLTLIVLPGLDGVGMFRSRFAEAMGAGYQVELVSFSTEVPLGYAELKPIVESIMARHERFVLLGESFSGPLACMLAAEHPTGLVGLVLCATFAKAPTPRALAPLVEWLPMKRVPKRLLDGAFFGKWRNPALTSRLQDTLGGIGLSVLGGRARSIVEVDVSACLESIEVPVLCLRAGSDRIVPLQTSQKLFAGLPDVRVVTIDGPHALLHIVPDVCARHVREFPGSLDASP